MAVPSLSENTISDLNNWLYDSGIDTLIFSCKQVLDKRYHLLSNDENKRYMFYRDLDRFESVLSTVSTIKLLIDSHDSDSTACNCGFKDAALAEDAKPQIQA